MTRKSTRHTKRSKRVTRAFKPLPRCQRITKRGKQCSRDAHGRSSYCWQHKRKRKRKKPPPPPPPPPYKNLQDWIDTWNGWDGDYDIYEYESGIDGS